MPDRIIFHVDVNSAFLSWEAVYRLHHLGGSLDLRTIPSAVGGDIAKRHGIILAKSIPAKKYKIQTGESVTDALKKCPELTLVPPNYGLYEKNSRAMMDILHRYSDAVEQYSIDEAFMDMTGTRRLYGNPVMAAAALKDEIFDKLGFTVNIGVADNKLLAKMASDFQKPNQVHTLFSWEIREKMWPLPLRDLFLLGAASERNLHSMGIRTIGELARTDVNVLRMHLKKHGETLWNFANGRDVAEVEAVPPENKGYGNSTTISFDVTDSDTAKQVLLSLTETVARRLRKYEVRAQLVSVSVRFADLSWESHQGVLDSATNITKELYQEAARLFDEMWNGMPIRHLGVHTGRIRKKEEYRQRSLFETMDYEKQERLDAAVDEIRNRFGTDSLVRASFLKQDRIDHMSGGISREKRSVDYSKEQVR